MTHQEKIDWMVQWAHKNNYVIESGYNKDTHKLSTTHFMLGQHMYAKMVKKEKNNEK